MTAEQIADVVDLVRGQLPDDLKLEKQTYKLEDEWLYITVSPAKAGIRASEFADAMARIEKDLRHRNIDNVLLVPTVND